MKTIEFEIPKGFTVKETNSEKVILHMIEEPVKEIILSGNLSKEFYRNGDPIPYAYTNDEWEWYGKNRIGCRCAYNNSTDNLNKYGYLYNWYAVNDPRGLASEGWHVPSDEELKVLSGILKKNILFSGYRSNNGNFGSLTYNAYFWSSTEHSSTPAWSLYLSYNSEDVYRFNYVKTNGFSVRCIKD